MYEAFFRFQSRPFPAAPVVANYFPAHSMESARQNLIRAIERGEGPGLVIGPTGVGKTLLLQVLADHFSRSLRVVLLSGARIATRKSLLQTILFELEHPYRGMDEGELRLALIDALRRDESIPHGILLLIDEAQSLSLRLLDEMRLITNITHDSQPRVRLVLAGTPRLEERFTNPKLESFNQRIAARCYLQAFSREETHEYLRAEVSWAGGDADSLFAQDTLRAVFQATDGIPRLINQVCDHALVLAHADGATQVDAHRIQEAWADMQQLPPPWQPVPTLGTGSSTTVIEFGELPDEQAGGPRPATLAPAPAATTLAASRSAPQASTPEPSPLVGQNDSPYVATESVELSFDSDSVVVNAPFAEEEWETATCGAVPSLLQQPVHVESDPFAESFEEDVVVIDRILARNLDGLRGRPRVTCDESRELAASLALIQGLVRPEIMTRLNPAPTCLAPLTQRADSFEFSTLQDLPAIDLLAEFTDELAALHAGVDEQVELDFDEDIDCVPLPWTRDALADDRDIIIVEDDSPSLGVCGGAEVGTDGGKRTEFRDLFAQLRRASR